MAVRRSPSKGSITYTDSNETISAACATQSQPDLRQMMQLDSEINKITLRKRKTPDDDISEKLDKFESRIMAMLTNMSQIHTEKLEKISEQFSEITNQITQIKLTTDQLSVEQSKVQKEIAEIQTSKITMEKNINELKTEFASLKTPIVNDINSTIFTHESMISEIYDRLQREKNIIISGIQELTSKNTNERIQYDKKEVLKVIKLADPNCAEPIKCFRLGKYNSEGHHLRPIKACFTSADTVKSILRNKNNIIEKMKTIKLYSDQTPSQKKEILKLRTELTERTEKGEENLVIRYNKGTPKIIKVSSKN
jgi:hypothetical protein